MGLLGKLLTFPVSGPLWVVEQITDEAERRLYDEGAIRAQLTELELAFEAGELTEEQLEEAEDILLDRLREARARRGITPATWIATHDDERHHDG